MRLEEIQAALRDEGLDGWLFFDHHQRDPLGYRVLQFTPGSMVTRRWYYFVPASGEPRGLVHAIERYNLDALPGDKRPYAGREQLASGMSVEPGPSSSLTPICSVRSSAVRFWIPPWVFT